MFKLLKDGYEKLKNFIIVNADSTKFYFALISKKSFFFFNIFEKSKENIKNLYLKYKTTVGFFFKWGFLFFLFFFLILPFLLLTIYFFIVLDKNILIESFEDSIIFTNNVFFSFYLKKLFNFVFFLRENMLDYNFFEIYYVKILSDKIYFFCTNLFESILFFFKNVVLLINVFIKHNFGVSIDPFIFPIFWYIYDLFYLLYSSWIDNLGDVLTEVFFFIHSQIKFFWCFDEWSLPIFFLFFILFILTNVSSLFFLSFLGFYGVFILNLISLILFWFSSIFYLNNFFIYNYIYNINLGRWFVLNLNFCVNFDLYIDVISFSFMFLTLTIAVFVYIYAFSYFRYEPNVERLILLINCFVISMILLVISGNFFVLFLGWELIGLTSFFLINFWSTRMSTVKSAFKAFVFNKVSDVALFTVVILVYFCFNEISISVFNQQISYYNTFFFKIGGYDIPFLEIVSFFFVLCAFIKSAQFGFHIWLPDSMEAPVPASALIHSATLVSAGIFILLRFSYLFEYSVYSYYVVPIIGSFTAFFGGLCSAYQSDIKKILAYSTISHCGFLMICYSTYIPEYTILYLYIHGFFKAAVFLCVGNIIRFSRNCQDFRRMGGFYKYLPFECFSSFICLINLSGLPFTIGFYIKHLLLIGVYLNNFLLYFIFINILGGAIFGLIYSYRLFYYVFFDFRKSKKIIYNQANREILKSHSFYSNTSLASNFAIFGLILTSYIVSLYLLDIFLNKSAVGNGLTIYSINSTQSSEFTNPVLTLFNNIGYFNWILLLFIFIIITASWRNIYKYYLVFDYIYLVIIFFIFFYIFYCLLTFL